MTAQFGFHFDASACIGCKACQTACQDKNDLPAEIAWRRVFHYSGGNWMKSGQVMVPSNVFSYYVTISCQHCQDAACVQVCPTTAMHKDDNGIVSIDTDKCIGCRYCEWACPYGAPHFNEDAGRMTKCDMCKDIVAEGQNPACVDACVMRALTFGDLEELKATYGEVDSIAPLPSAQYTKPSMVITPHKNAQPVGDVSGKIVNLMEEL
jgi:anaerobic dimethyl sulfoxide reductase subunit B (iron-sulfur subunit)